MTEKVLDTLSDDTLLSMVTRGPQQTGAEGFDEDFLMQLAMGEISNSIDTQTGAPSEVRFAVSAAQTPESTYKGGMLPSLASYPNIRYTFLVCKNKMHRMRDNFGMADYGG